MAETNTTKFYELENGTVVNIDAIADFGHYETHKSSEIHKKTFLLKKIHQGKSGHPENIMITYNDYVGLFSLLQKEGRLKVNSDEDEKVQQ